jgi:hypothetical protein
MSDFLDLYIVSACCTPKVSVYQKDEKRKTLCTSCAALLKIAQDYFL